MRKTKLYRKTDKNYGKERNDGKNICMPSKEDK